MKWTVGSRGVAFLLGFSSIGALIAHFYGVATMAMFVPAITLPCFLMLAGWGAIASRRGWHEISRAIWIGVVAGFVGAIFYDVIRLPFVIMHAMGVKLPGALPLFKVFVRFGAMILGQPIEQAHYTWLAHLLGWTYHFSNAAGFGLMYLALVGSPLRRHWVWAVVMALGLEAGMLLMPYAQTFSIRVSFPFILVTVTAHIVFGAVLGLTARRLARSSMPLPSGA